MHGGYYPGMESTKPSFDLPVVYEDDHFAIVNKPAGVVVYSQRKHSHGMMSVRAALPFALRPPKRGTLAIIRRPVSVHRLDKPTSGLLLVAKTKPAMVHLTAQFVQRKVKKTYTAILNGIPSEPVETSISAQEAIKFGVDIDPCDEKKKWQLIDESLDDKSASTVWRPLKYVKSLKARDGILTLVEMKPKTGRYHQLRRHMAWVKNCPIIGDTVYDGGGDAMSLRGRGLFLCSNKVSLEHPYYNSPEGRREWESLSETEKWANGAISLSQDGSTVQVHASIDLPDKFYNFLVNEGERYEMLGGEQ
jgi:23S rRNA-/tRNA-specific pseudouridylate synthase